MFVLALCLVGTALALPAIPPAPILPLEGVIISKPEVVMTYGASPELAPFTTLKFMIEPEPKEEKEEELKEEKEELVLVKKEEEELKKEEEPKKPIEELKPETVYIKLDIPKPPSFISDWFSYLNSFSLPAPISNWLSSGNKLPSRILYPGVPGYVIVEGSKP